jgi:hypothetical protein
MILEISGDPNPAVTLERARGGRQHLRDLAHRFRANR